MKTQKILIGTPTIVTPNLFGKVVNETPKTIEIEIVGVSFKSKSSRSITVKFDEKDRRDHFKKVFVGQRRKFWKESGQQVGGSSFIPNHTIVLAD